jgi:DNA-directed RNA polymerase subunit alpha
VLHEFSSIAGVREDVTDIVLNIKDIAIKMQGDGPKRMVVKKQGPGTVTANDIQTVGDIVVLNPDLVLCTLDEGAEIRMEFTVNTGKGYIPSERNRPEDAPIGLIPVDSLYSPVRKVSYKVENTREGQILDYDKLTLTIETNGALSPEDALAYAARICRISSMCSSISKSRSEKPQARRSRIWHSIRRSSRRSTSSSCPYVRPTA